MHRLFVDVPVDRTLMPMSTGEPFSRAAYRARWIFPVEAPPIECATIEIENGRIAALHDRHDPRAVDLGNVALIPGLVNAHTHLELSDVESPLAPAHPFTVWLRAVIAHRRARSTDATSAAKRLAAGLAEAAAAGTTLLGDIVGPDWCEPLGESGTMQTVAFLELLGLRSERVGEQISAARRFLTREETREEAQPGQHRICSSSRSTLPGLPASRVLRALSPHAPYSVHPELFHGAVDLASEFRAPLAIHLAETTAELQLLRDGTGEFRTFLEELGAWNPAPFSTPRRPLDFLEPLACLDCALVIHGNYLAEEDLRFLSRHQHISVIYCPRTHAYFAHAPHPWREMLARGINVAVGTDSRASNPDLGVWNELQHLHRRFPDVPQAELLRLGTLNGARALGRDKLTGSLLVGKSADVAVISLPDATATDPHPLLFRPAGRPVKTMSRGVWHD